MPFTYLDKEPSKTKFTYLDEKPVSAAKKPALIGTLLGTTPEELSKKGSWVKGGLLQTAEDLYREGISPLMSGASTLALGIPKAVAKRTGTQELLFPEQETTVGKIQRFGWEATGFIKGAAVKGGQWILGNIPKIAGKGMVKAVARGAAAGATAGLLQTPEEGEGILKPKERLRQAGTLGAIGAVTPPAVASAKFVAGIAAKSGRWISKNIGGVTDASLNIIKRLGADRVFDPVKAQIDYISSNVVPRVRERITNLITDFTPKSKFVLKQVGMTPEEIEILSTVDKSKLVQLKKVFGNDWNAIKGGLEGIKESADLQFKTTLQNNPNARINPKNTFYRLGSLLRKEGWIDAQGNELEGAGISNKVKTNLIKIYKDLSGGTYGKARKTPPAPLNTQQYFNKLSELEATVSGNPKLDRLIFDTGSSLRNDAAKVVKGLAQANKSYSDATKLLDLEKVFTKVADPINWEKQLIQLKNVSKSQTHLKYKNILGADIYDDVLAHLANQDFELVSSLPAPGGGFYPSKSGFIRKGVAGISKKYYQKVAPRLSALDEITKKTRQKMTPELLKSILGE